jgi:hypothetical protein
VNSYPKAVAIAGNTEVETAPPSMPAALISPMEMGAYFFPILGILTGTRYPIAYAAAEKKPAKKAANHGVSGFYKANKAIDIPAPTQPRRIIGRPISMLSALQPQRGDPTNDPVRASEASKPA